MDRQKFEQSRAIKFCVKLGESATATYENLQRAYGEHSLSRAQVFRWHKSFLEGQEQVEEEPRAGRTSISKTNDNVERVRSLVRSDGRLTLRMISSELNLNRFTGSRQHRGCIIPQTVTHSLVLLKMGKIISRNMLS